MGDKRVSFSFAKLDPRPRSTSPILNQLVVEPHRQMHLLNFDEFGLRVSLRNIARTTDNSFDTGSCQLAAVRAVVRTHAGTGSCPERIAERSAKTAQL